MGRWEDNIKLDVREIRCDCELDSYVLENGPVKGPK
jgi:hypothetical protein